MSNERLGRVAATTEKGLQALALKSARNPRRTLGIVLLLTIASTLFAARLRLSADLIELLPDTFESVQQLERLAESFGGFGFVVPVATGAEHDQLKQFAEDVGPLLEKEELVRYVDYRRPAEFFDEHGFFYLDREDLELVKERLAEREAYERRVNNPLYVDLEEEDPPSLEFPELQSKYMNNDDAMSRSRKREDYYFDPEIGIIALFAKPSGVASDLGFSQRVVGAVKGVIADVDLSKYGENIRVDYGGAFTKKVDQQVLITGDLKMATIVALILVMLYLGFHFRRLTAVALLITPLLVGLSWTYGFAYLTFGILNILTGFIGAILLGLGIDHGIHLLERFGFEYSKHKSLDEAVRITFGSTGRAVAVAAITTTVGFAGLGLSEFRAFHEFGIIAAAGMVLLVASYLITLPALLAVAIDRGWRPRHGDHQAAAPYAKWLPRRAGIVGAVTIAMAIGLFYSGRNATFNYDTRSLADSQLYSFRLDAILDGLLGYSQSPVIILTKNIDEERRVAEGVRQRKKSRGKESSIDLVMARSDLVPQNQAEKVPVIREIGEILDRVKPKWLERKNRKHLKTLRKAARAEPFTYEDLPEQVTRQFEGPSGSREESFVLVFSNLDLSDGRNALIFAREVQKIPVTGRAEPVSAVGEAMIMADVYDMVAREASPVLTITLVLVFLTMLILMGSLRRTLLCMIPAVLTIVGTMGVLPLAHMEFNTLNIVMIPVLFGIGVDGGVHLVSRLTEDSDLPVVLTEIGRAICAALLTTGLGFGALMLADHSGLKSLGSLALVGLAVNLLSCLVALPALLAQRWRKKREIVPKAAA